ncbi:iron uptake porin [Phormidesmis sp. 146-35]
MVNLKGRGAVLMLSGMLGVLLASPGGAESSVSLIAQAMPPQTAPPGTIDESSYIPAKIETVPPKPSDPVSETAPPPAGTPIAAPVTAPPQASQPIAPVPKIETVPLQASETPTAAPSVPAEAAPSQAPSDTSQPQVTSVSQLSDVRPTDWAFQALQSLVERYGCIAGYPDKTYRGNRAMTRYEFAAGLNACLDRVNELIAASTADLVKKEDLVTLQRLQEEFAGELATLRGRVDALEARTTTLEKQQFSTTTKLSGEAIFAVTDFFGDQASDFGNNNAVLQDRVRVDLQTSFSGRDILHTRLTAGNFITPNSPASLAPAVPQGTAEGTLSSSVNGDSGNQVSLDRLDYTFPIGEQIKVYVAATGGRSSHFVSTANPFFDDQDGGNGSISTFGQQNPIYRIGGGAGFAVSFALDRDERFVLTGGYLSENAPDPATDRGLFGGNDAVVGQLTLKPSPALQVGLTFVHGFHFSGNSIFDMGGDRFLTGTAPANALNTGLGLNAFTNSYGASVAFRLSPGIAINAFGGYTDLMVNDRTFHGEIWYYGVGLAFPDLLKKGSLGGVVVGVEPYLGSVDRNNISLTQLGLANDTSLHVEAFYRYQVNDRISITPGVIWVTAPDQSRNNADSVIGTLRTTFSF